MRIIYITLFAVSITVVLLTTVLSVKSDKAIAKNLHLLLNMTFFAGLGNLVVLVSQNRIICMLGYSVFFAGIDWIAYYLLRFTIEYTGFTGNFPKVQKAVKYILLLDTVSMFLNLFLEHAFSCYPVVKDGEIYYRIHSYLCYDIHLVISYITNICKSGASGTQNLQIFFALPWKIYLYFGGTCSSCGCGCRVCIYGGTGRYDRHRICGGGTGYLLPDSNLCSTRGAR